MRIIGVAGFAGARGSGGPRFGGEGLDRREQ